MDPCIENLKSTTFFGKRLTRRQIADIQETVALFPGLSRRELGNTICEHLGWFTPKGGYRVQSCLGMLEQLEALGILSLPEARASMRRGPRRKPVWTCRSDPGPAIGTDLKRLTPLVLQVVTQKDAVEEWNELVDRHHYLGSRRPFGSHLRYFILDNQGRKLGCLMFEAATTTLPCRDAWIGWRAQDRAKRLELVVNNSRFIVFPWVEVKFLASKALSTALRQLADDWDALHGFRPLLAETFVDVTKFDATCYRAANWQKIGMTKGRKARAHGEGKTQKGVYVFPLARNCRSTLLNGPRPVKRRRRPPPAFAPDDPFVRLWSGIIGTAIAVANGHDRAWQQRRRVLNTLLIMLFIFRLVFSKGRQGYAITLAELWDQCRALGIELPQPTPVSASAMCNARAKLDENVFKVLHAGILEQVSGSRGANGGKAGKLWRGHRIFAVDGSKMNLPRPLIAEGYRTPSDNAHYPQGLVSCLYQLRLKLPVDFDLHAHGNEREAALAHLKALSESDVVVYDRGYWSYEMLRAHVARGLHPVFRIKRKAGGRFDEFINDSDRTDAIVEVAPGARTLRKLRRKHPAGTFGPYRLRLVKYEAGGTVFILGTTLLDRDTYRIEDLSNLYHGRWGIEELYKISKQMMGVDDFHGHSGRGVKQELFAHFVLIALTRLFTNHGEAGINPCLPGDDKPEMQANFKNGLAVVARNIESLLLRQAAVLGETVTHIVAAVAACRQRLRPNRSYQRRSRKPAGTWQRHTTPKAAAAG